MVYHQLTRCNCFQYLRNCQSASWKVLNPANPLLKPENAKLMCGCSYIFTNFGTGNILHFKHDKNIYIKSKLCNSNANNTSTSILKINSHVIQFWKCFSDRNSEWENLLSSEKRNNIQDIPVTKENIYTIPNLLCCLRIGLSPYIGYLIIYQNFSSASVLSFLAALTDVVVNINQVVPAYNHKKSADGYIARKWPSQQSALGSALDPLADKILVSVLAVCLTYVNVIPVVLTSLFIGRDVLLIGAVFYLRYKTCPPPVTLKRYFDPTLVNAKLAPTKISKVNTALQMAVIWISLASPVFNFTDHTLLKGLWCASAITTIASGLSYVRRKDTVRILKESKKKTVSK